MSWWMWVIVAVVGVGVLRAVYDFLMKEEKEKQSYLEKLSDPDNKYFQYAGVPTALSSVEELKQAYKIIARRTWDKKPEEEKILYVGLVDKEDGEEKPEWFNSLVKIRRICESGEDESIMRKKIIAVLKKDDELLEEFSCGYDREDFLEDEDSSEDEFWQLAADEYLVDWKKWAHADDAINPVAHPEGKIVLKALSRSGNGSYDLCVEVNKSNALSVICTCKAGSRSSMCHHKERLIRGDKSLVERSQHETFDAARVLILKTEIPQAYFEALRTKDRFFGYPSKIISKNMAEDLVRGFPVNSL